MQQERQMDFENKITALRKLLTKKDGRGLLLTQHHHFSWLMGGRSFIGLTAPAACGSIMVTMDAVYLITDNVEAQRLYLEQCGQNPSVQVRDYPWYQPEKREHIIRELCPQNLLTEADVAKELLDLRTVLSPYEITCYRDICKTTAEVLEDVCRTLREGMTEYELGGEIAKQMWANNLEPITLLIGFDERAYHFRHPVLNGAALKNYALVAVCCRRNGLITSITRIVALKHPGEEMMRRQRVAAYVDATMQAATRPGTTLSEIFTKCQKAYAEKGFEKEWTFHHQGGLTGFNTRETKAMPAENHCVRLYEAYAWNPSCQGVKVENTTLVTPDGIEFLTHTGNYPYIEVEIDGKTYYEEDILILHP